MGVRKKLLFVAGVKDYNIFNRQSAIDSILCSIMLSLQEHYAISVNGKPLPELQKAFEAERNEHASVQQLSRGGGLKRLIPAKLKERIKDKRLFRNNELLVEQLCDGPKPDLVFELMKYGSDVGKQVAEHFDVPMIAYFDAPCVTQFREIRGFYPVFKKQMIDNQRQSIAAASEVIVYSKPVRDFWLERLPRNPAKYHIFQTLDYSRLTQLERKKNAVPVIGFIGTFMQWHRVGLLVKAFDQLRHDGFNAKLLLVGAGEEFALIKQLVEESKFKADIELPGFVDGDRLNHYKQQIDIGVMPSSNWYGIPTKVFEYGACGTAALAPDTPTIADIFEHEENVLLFGNNNFIGLYEALERLLKDETLREQLGKSLQQKITIEYSLEKATDFYRQLIEKAISSASAKA